MSLTDTYIPDSVKKTLEALSTRYFQTVLLCAPRGYGKEFIARLLAHNIAERKEYILDLSNSTEESIGIDVIRTIQSFVSLRSLTKNTRRVVLITHADTLTTEAQNALLKILEEPPEGVSFILTVHSVDALLPTVLSRAEVINLHVGSIEKFVTYLESKGHNAEKIKSVLAQTSGLPALTLRLLNGNGDDAYSSDISSAKEIFGLTALERLKRVDTMSKDKAGAERLMRALLLICKTAVYNTQSLESRESWRVRSQHVLHALKLLQKNVSTKLILTQLFVEL
jgi:uncharacterized protein (DUF1778 family)